MKLKPININGYTVLVDEDESAEIKEGDVIFESDLNTVNIVGSNYSKNLNDYKIIFADPKLNLDVPILPNWREWEVEQLSKGAWELNGKELESSRMKRLYISAFKQGYNHNQAKYTEEDLRKAIKAAKITSYGGSKYTENEIIQSLQKYPKYIVMENDDIFHSPSPIGMSVDTVPKLTTNAQGKKVGIIKEIIY